MADHYIGFQAPATPGAAPGGKKTRAKRTKPKNCTGGFPCGKACINRNFVCRSNLGPDGQKLTESFADFVKRTVNEDTFNRLTPELQAKIREAGLLEGIDEETAPRPIPEEQQPAPTEPEEPAIVPEVLPPEETRLAVRDQDRETIDVEAERIDDLEAEIEDIQAQLEGQPDRPALPPEDTIEDIRAEIERIGTDLEVPPNEIDDIEEQIGALEDILFKPLGIDQPEEERRIPAEEERPEVTAEQQAEIDELKRLIQDDLASRAEEIEAERELRDIERIIDAIDEELAIVPPVDAEDQTGALAPEPLRIRTPADEIADLEAEIEDLEAELDATRPPATPEERQRQREARREEQEVELDQEEAERRKAVEEATAELTNEEADDDVSLLVEDIFDEFVENEVFDGLQELQEELTDEGRIDLGKPESRFNIDAPDGSTQDDVDRIDQAIEAGILTEEEANSLKKRLGGGAFGAVYTRDDGSVIKIADGSAEEIEASKLASKLGIGPKVFDAKVSTEDEDSIFGAVTAMTMAMENLKDKGFDTLFNRQQEGKFTEEQMDSVTADAINKLALLAENGLIHEDAHTENVMVNDQGEARWIDYGLISKVSLEELANDPKRAKELFLALSAFAQLGKVTPERAERMNILDPNIKEAFKLAEDPDLNVTDRDERGTQAIQKFAQDLLAKRDGPG